MGAVLKLGYCLCMGTMVRGCVLSLELSTEAEVHHPILKRAHQAKAYMVFGLNLTYALRQMTVYRIA